MRGLLLPKRNRKPRPIPLWQEGNRNLLRTDASLASCAITPLLAILEMYPRMPEGLLTTTKTIGEKTCLLRLCCGVGATYFPYEEMEGLASRGVISNILPEYPRLDEIAKGSYDAALTAVATEATKYGQQHGGFFYSPMRIPNGKAFPWCGNPRWIQECLETCMANL